MNERYEIQRELKKFFEKITLDNCGHLLQNHINKTEEQLKNRLKNNQKLEIVSSFYGSKAAIMQHIKDDLLSEDCLEQLTDYFLEKNDWKRTTTLTILGRLEKKNFLKIDRELRMNRYTPLVKRQDYLDFATKYYLENVFSNSVKKLFAGLLDSKEITKEELLKELKEI